MHFEYEIGADEFVASQLLYYKLSLGRKRVERAAYYFLAGLIFIAVAWKEWSNTWAPILVALVGAWCICSAFASFSPATYFLRAYPRSEVAGKRFKADVSEDGFEVTGDSSSWRIRWPGVRYKG